MLTIEEIAKAAPAAMARRPAAHCSPKYSFIPTLDALDALRKDGYVPVAARQDMSGDDGWGRHKHCRHMITLRLRGTETMDRSKMLGGLVPELRLYNSSDAGSPFSLEKAVYRQICSNGLFGFGIDGAVNTVHKYVTAEDVIARARALAAASKPLFDKIQKWSKIRLNDLAQQRFAAQALVERLGGDPERAKRYDVLSIIKPQRSEDAEPTLWNLFNRAQENGMKGLIEVRKGTNVQALTSLNAERRFNIAMWALAEKWGAYVK